MYRETNTFVRDSMLGDEEGDSDHDDDDEDEFGRDFSIKPKKQYHSYNEYVNHGERDSVFNA